MEGDPPAIGSASNGLRVPRGRVFASAPTDAPGHACVSCVPPEEVKEMARPENGWSGRREWVYDAPAGLVVSFVSIAFGLAIASASGAPPVAGLISTIVSGFVFFFLAGKTTGPFVTVSGPAAGLVPTTLAIVLALGEGNPVRGFPLLLVAVLLSGVLQVVAAALRLGRFAGLLPNVVVEGMLAGIGLLVIAKEIPVLMGCAFHAHGFWSVMGEVPTHVRDVRVPVFVLGGLTFVLMFVLDATKAKWTKVVPPPVIGVVLGTTVGWFMGIAPGDCVSLPTQGFAWHPPAVQEAFSQAGLLKEVLIGSVLLAVIGGIESVATVAAIDRIDHFHRKSDPNRALLVVGVANILCGLVGGIAIIPGGVKSTANVQAGGRTQWSNLWNAVFLLLSLAVGGSVLRHVPQTVLAAVVLFIGWKLCRPAVWRHARAIGREQLVVFAVTVFATITQGLLWGILFGLAAKLVATVALLDRASKTRPLDLRLDQRVAATLRSPIVGIEMTKTEMVVTLAGPVVCFNTVPLRTALASRPASVRTIRFHLDQVTFMDHTSVTVLMDFQTQEEFQGMRVYGLEAMERLDRVSDHPEAARMRSLPPAAPLSAPV